jgi:hypothetical protein
MGFLTLNGYLMTYDEYKHWQVRYKRHGLMQFVKLFNIHKDRFIPRDGLHWGEEIEYSLYNVDDEGKSVRLAIDADDIMKSFKSM